MATLDYGARANWVRRRWRRVCLVVLLVVASVAGAWQRRNIVWAVQRAWLLRSQRQCLAFEAQPARIVYEEDPAMARELLSRNDYRPATLDAQGQRTGAVWWPPEVQNYPDAWRYLWGGAGRRSNTESEAALLFLHERTTPSGLRVLVCAGVWVDRLPPEPMLRFVVRVVTPATWRSDPQVAGGLGAYPIEIARYADHRPLRIYGGRPDPADTSRFTVAYEVGGRRGVLEGRIKDAPLSGSSPGLPVEVEFDTRAGGPQR